MLSISATLQAAEKAMSQKPIAKIVLTKSGESTVTYNLSDRIIDIKHREAIYDYHADVLVDNSDQALKTLDLRGYKGVLSYGFNTSSGDEYAARAPLWVIGKQNYSWEGGLVTVLTLAGTLNLLQKDKADEAYTPGSDNTDTIKTILTAIAEATLPCWHHSNTYVQYTITFDSEDSIIDSFIPGDSFRVNVGDNRLDKMRELLRLTKCVVRVENDEEIHIFQPTVSGSTFDKEYRLTGDFQTFWRDQYRKFVVIPNDVTVKSRPGDSPQYTGNATDGSSSLLWSPLTREMTLVSDAEAAAIAAAIIETAQLEAEGGRVHAPMNLAQEVYDYVKVTDERLDDNQFGNIGYIDRHYQPGKYEMTFGFGLIAEGGFAGTLPPQLKRSPEKLSLGHVYDLIEEIWKILEGLITFLETLPGAGGRSGVTIRKNSINPAIGTRPQLNLIEGSGVSIVAEDDPSDDEVDLTFSSKYPTRYIPLIPDDAALPSSNPAALATVSGTNLAYETLDFDHTTEESVNWIYFLTPDYLGENMVADIYWLSAGAGDAKFGLSVLGRESGETWDNALGSEQTVTQTNAGAGKLNIARITTFSPGWTAGDSIIFKLARKAADGADTINSNDVQVLKLVVSYTPTFTQSFYPLAVPVDVTPASADAWVDADMSAYVPVGATGVILRFDASGAGAGSRYAIGARMKGSTDNRIDKLGADFQTGAMCGLDSDRKCQLYVDVTTVKVYLAGYTGTGVQFFENATEKSPGSYGSYIDMDCSGQAPSDAIGLIFECTEDQVTDDRQLHIRKNGSTDDLIERLWSHTWVIVGCDAGQIAEAEMENAEVHIYLVGYVTSGATFKTNMDDVTPLTAGAYITKNLSTEAPSARMIFFLTNFPALKAIRKHSGSEDIYTEVAYGYGGLFIACDANQKVDMKVSSIGGAAATSIYVSGYAT